MNNPAVNTSVLCFARHPRNPIFAAAQILCPAAPISHEGVTKLQGKRVKVFRNDHVAEGPATARLAHLLRLCLTWE